MYLNTATYFSSSLYAFDERLIFLDSLWYSILSAHFSLYTEMLCFPQWNTFKIIEVISISGSGRPVPTRCFRFYDKSFTEQTVNALPMVVKRVKYVAIVKKMVKEHNITFLSS